MKLKIKAGIHILAMSVMLFSVGATAGTIKGILKNAGKNQYIYLYQYLGSELYKIDSSKLITGEFRFKDKGLPRGLYKLGTSEEQSFNIVLADENIEVTADLKDLNTSVVIAASKENEVYAIFNNYNQKYNQEFSKLDQLAQPVLALRGSDPEKFNNEIKKLQVKLDSINKERNSYFKQFASEYGTSFTSKLAAPFLVDDAASKATYFTPSDLSDPEFSRSDVLSNKIILYLQKYSIQQLPQLQEESNYLLSLPAKGAPNKEVFYITLIKIFAMYDPEYTARLAAAYKEEFPASLVAKKIIAGLPKPAPRTGETAPDIKLSNPNGKVLSLSSYKGKIILLDFWASWCGPCRQENPNVVRAYQKYKDKGFTIFSVSLDDNKDKWQQAIQKDGLLWDAHVSDLKGWQSSAAQLYQVKGIPATFLIGKDGKIVGTNLRGENLEAKLAELCQ
jgi:peroxiredoxin